MDRWFEEFQEDFENRSWVPAWPWSGTSAIRPRQPLTDLVDEGREFVVKAELPGVSKEDLDITVTEDGIELRAEARREKEEREKGFFLKERSYSAFHRALSFPAEVLADEAVASLRDGVLEVRVPKKEPTPKREPVKVRVT
ncbi:MAG: Hsp20/alpha crystallin family protein [Methanobacteriota archaeon]